MRNYSFYLIISLGLFLSNCQETPKGNLIQTGNLSFDTFSHTWYAAFCSDDTSSCARVIASYPLVSDNPSGVGKTINDSILKFVKSSINSFQLEQSGPDITVENLVAEFFNEYQNFVLDFPEFEMPWTIEIKGKVLFNSDQIISVELEEYSFTGGAHPNYGITLLNFDLATGKILALEDIVDNPEKLKIIAREKFRIARHLKANQSFEDAGFFFGDSFILPANFALTEEGLFLFYNPYEVGAYVLGPTSFTIPYQDIESIINVP